MLTSVHFCWYTYLPFLKGGQYCGGNWYFPNIKIVHTSPSDIYCPLLHLVHSWICLRDKRHSVDWGEAEIKDGIEVLMKWEISTKREKGKGHTYTFSQNVPPFHKISGWPIWPGPTTTIAIFVSVCESICCDIFKFISPHIYIWWPKLDHHHQR